MKSSGQMGTKIFGNRSYSQNPKEDSLLSKTEKSGYYITINFNGKTLNLVRFGWIDFEDWTGQSSATGQAATLSDNAYRYKLIPIVGEYQLHSSIKILDGIGEKRAENFLKHGIATIQDVLEYKGTEKFINKLKEKVKETYIADSKTES